MAKSNKQWLHRHVTDVYVRRAKAQGYRSRAAFKLIEIDAKEGLLRPGATVIDLGAAPGGWSQVAAEKVKPGGRVIAVDVLDIAPISGVKVLKADFREKGLMDALQGAEADVVLSDLSPNLSGIANVDQARAAELARAVIDLCRKALKPQGVFVIKVFHGEAYEGVLANLKEAFRKVKALKPAASRGESAEMYLVARGLFCSGKRG